MKILVCISNVPDTTTKITFTSNNTQFNAAGVQFIINPYDEIALARAVELAEGGKGKVTVIHVGEASAEPTIRKALAIGADDAVRINAAPADAYTVAYQIAQYAQNEGFDLILTGRESIDYNGAKVAGMLAEFLNLPSVSIAKKLDIDGNTATIDREIEGGKEIVAVQLPAVIGTAEGVAEAKIPNMRGIMSARTKPLTVVEPAAINPLSSITSFETPAPRSQVKLAADAAELLNWLHTQAKAL